MEEDNITHNQLSEHTFKATLLNKNQDINITYNPHNGKKVIEETMESDSTSLTSGYKEKINQPWQCSVIIKLHEENNIL